MSTTTAIPDPMKDAARSAVAIMRMFAAGDETGIDLLIATMDDADRSHLCGALAAMCNAAFGTMDAMAEQMGLPGRSADILANMVSGTSSQVRL